MIQYITQAPVEVQAKASLWLRQFESDPPDQSAPLIGLPDEGYRPSVDEDLSDDRTFSMTPSAITKVSASDSRAGNYATQLSEAKITNADGQLVTDFFGLDNIFNDDEVLKAATLQHPAESLDKILEQLVSLKDHMQAGVYKKDEWVFHTAMHGVLIEIIDPGARAQHTDGCKDYLVTSPGNWNYAAKVLLDKKRKNLSQPKVDSCFLLSMDQENVDEGSPLARICATITSGRNRCTALRAERSRLAERMATLLSLSKLREMNTYEALAEVCFCHATEIKTNGNYPISWFELKKDATEMLTCVNQIVNAGVFNCAKQVDLLLQAKEFLQSKDLRSAIQFDIQPQLFERVVALGMCISGEEWKIMVVISKGDRKLAAAEYEYDVLVQGDWHRNPRKFVGAVIAMHEYMQDRTCRLLVDCFEVFDRWIETTKPKPHSSATPDLLKQRVIPTEYKPETLEAIKEGNQ